MAEDGDRRSKLRRIVWTAILLCVLAEALGLGILWARGAAGPPRPVISPVGRPADPTSETSAAFMFTSAQPVTFECSLDAGRFTPCGLGYFGSKSYPGPLPAEWHTFEVRAVADGRISPPASYWWTIAPGGDEPAEEEPEEVDEPAPDDTDRDPPPSSGSDGDAGASVAFEISGRVSGLAPGVTKAIVVTLRNPNPWPIRVTRLRTTISADSTPPGCPSGPNLVLEQATGITPAHPVLVPARGSVTLRTPPRAPRLTFRNRPVNQDVCKKKTFELDYSGWATS